MKILVRGPVSVSSGYGMDVVGLLQELVAQGDDVCLWPTYVEPPVPEKVARLLTKPLRRDNDVVLLYNPPDELVSGGGYRQMGRRVVGWTMWERTPVTLKALELEPVPAEARAVFAQNPRAFAGLDQLIVTCPMNVEAFRAVDRVVPIDVIAPGLQAGELPELDRRGRQGPVVFGACGVMSSRKDPWSLLRAWELFRSRHPEVRARLEIKTLPPTLHPGLMDRYPDLVIHEEMWSRQQLVQWYAGLDVLVSASRGEGMNKPAVEFMATGGPVIATRWGGHGNWMSSSVGWPVEHVVEESLFEPGTVDARVVVESLADQLAAAACDPEGRVRRGAAASSFVRSGLMWMRAVDKFRTVVGRLG